MKENSEAAANVFRVHEWGFVIAACVLFMLVNLITLSRLPIVWNDEVMYAGPAINLAQGNGFHSSLWYAQNSTSFWAGNVPLHALLLSVWLKLLGISPASVRSFNCLAYLGAVIFIWAGARRARIVSNAAVGLVLIALLLVGYGVTFSYRSGRPDALTALIGGSLFFAFTFQPGVVNCSVILALGCLALLAGLQLVMFLCLFCVLLIAFTGRLKLRQVCFFGFGMFLALAMLYCLYSHFGAWQSFVTSTLGKHSALAATDARKARSYHIDLGGLTRDYSLIVLFALAAMMTAVLLRLKLLKIRSCFIFCLVASLLIPLGLFMIGVFPIYYSWMAYCPLCVGIASVFHDEQPQAPKWLSCFAMVCVLIAGLIGLPGLTILAISEWKDRDPGQVDALVRESVRASDVVWCDPAAYYAVKRQKLQLFSAMYQLSPQERSNVTLVLMRPTTPLTLSTQFGGRWQESSDSIRPDKPPFLGSQSSVLFGKYDLRAYRRVD